MLPVDKIVLTKSTLFNFWNILILKTPVSAFSSQINQSASPLQAKQWSRSGLVIVYMSCLSLRIISIED